MSLNKIDYIEFYVFNAFQAANFYKSVLGFDIIAYGGPETGLKDKISYILKQGTIKLIISSALDTNSAILQHVFLHDDGIKDIAFSTKNTSAIFEESIKMGAISVLEPSEINDGKEKIIKATVASFGNTVHSFIERQTPSDILPFYAPLHYATQNIDIGLEAIDHLAIAVEGGTIKKWQEFYENVFGFHLFYSEDIYLGNSGMRSVVVANRKENIKFTLVEPVSGLEKSQVDTYISYNKGAGVQHLAFLSEDIIQTVNSLKDLGINFLNIPESYYEGLKGTIYQKLDNDKLDSIKKLNILVDEDKEGYLMQVFSKPLQNRPTFFIEIIQRENAKGFGSGNIKALYEAVQKNQQVQEIGIING